MAGFRIDVRSNVKRVAAEFRAMRTDIADKATTRALNRALDKVATETGREVRKEYNVKLSAVRSALKKRRAHSKRLEANMIVEGVRLGLIEFDARWRSGMPIGASVRVKTAAGRKSIRGAFIAQMRSGRIDVFRRRGKKRLKIDKLDTLSIPQAVMNKIVLEALEHIAVDTFNKNLEQQLRFLSGGRMR